MQINVVVRSEESAAQFLKRHNSFSDRINVVRGASSLFEVISALVADGDDVEVFCHDDVYLPSDFLDSVDQWIEEADREWPNWGMVGNAGVPLFPMGLGAHEVVRFLADPHGGPTGCEKTIPCQSVDGNLMIFNCKALRSKGFVMPRFSGFHLYDLVAGIETLRCGLAVLASPALFCFHDSKGSQAGFENAWKSLGFQNYLAERLVNRKILTVNGPVDIERPDQVTEITELFDLPLAALLNASEGRPQPSIEIVTRTTFERLGLLERNCLSVDIANDVAGVEIGHTIVTGNRVAPKNFCERSVVIHESDLADDRYELVLAAASRSDADFVWFVDDDDWVFPNRIALVLKALSVCGGEALVCGGAVQFSESFWGDVTGVEFGESAPLRVFDGKDLIKSFSGHNFLPFSACLFPTEVLRKLPEGFTKRITYFEDFATILFVASNTPDWTMFLPWPLTGISIRSDSSQTVSMESREEWNRSMAEFRPLFLGKNGVGQITDVVSGSIFQSPNERLIRDNFIVGHLTAQRDEAIRKLDELAKHWTWRATRPLRLFARLRRLRRKSA